MGHGLRRGLHGRQQRRERRLRALVLLAVGFLDAVEQLVGFVLRHLAAPHHELHDVASAFDRETGETGGRVDDFFHGGGHLAAGFHRYFGGLRGHFGDGIARILAAVAGVAARRHDHRCIGLCREFLGHACCSLLEPPVRLPAFYPTASSIRAAGIGGTWLLE